MGLYGTKKNPEDIRYEAMAMMEKTHPKAAISLLDVIFQEDTFDFIQNSMRKNRMGGNMVVVAKKE